MKVSEFGYDLPDEAIAQSAIEPRDAARLLDTRDMTDHVFRDLPDLLEPGDLVVVNETRVRKARLLGSRVPGGGAVELLILKPRSDGRWDALARPARRLRPGSLLELDGRMAEIVQGPDDGVVVVDFGEEDMEAGFDQIGEVPLPPYFHGALPDPERYQTMFATTAGSAAAPTAGLHFTPNVVAGLAARSIGIARVDLHVGTDTFRPMSVTEIEDHRMHREWCSVPEETAVRISEVRADGGRVVAVGTTTVRALETFSVGDGTVSPGATDTDLFLRPGSRFEVVDVMVTNFHVPGSSLVVMVAAFMGPGWRDAYEHALRSGYRFLSFGDVMLCERGPR